MMEPAEQVAVAMQSGPDKAEFVSDYWAMLEPADRRSPTLARDIAYAWAERAMDAVPEASDEVYEDVVSNVEPDIAYYLPQRRR